MDAHHYHQTRILVNYVFMKLNNRVDNLKMEDLTRFFNEKGWYMYDMDKMVNDIQQWKGIKKSR